MSESNRRHAVALGLSKVPQQPRDSSPGDLPGAAVPGAGQHLPLGCRCRCRCSWGIHSPGPPSRSRTHRRPWSSGHDLGVTAGITWAPVLCHSPSPACGSPTFFGVHRGCKGASSWAANRLHSILPACLQAQSPCRPSLVTQPPVPVPPAQDTLSVPPDPAHAPAGGLWGALTVAEEAGGARALQDVELAEGAVEAQGLVLGVALALPAQALAPPRARLRVPRADAGFVVGGRGRGALARVPSPGDREGAERGRSRAQHSAVLGRVPGASACAAVGPRTQQDPWERGVRIRTQPLPARVANALSADKVPMETALGRVQLLLLEERREEALLNGPGCPQGHFRNQKGRSRGKVLP